MKETFLRFALILLTITATVTNAGSAPPALLAGAPTVNAGPDKTLSLPAKDLTLFGHATDPENDPLRGTWTMTSGPTSATFSAPWALATTVTFTTPGTYVFELSVSDGTSTVSDTATVTVNPASSQTAFYVDPTYTGSVSDGSAARPWKTLSLTANDAAWTAINNALAANDAIIYFSARQAVSDVSEIVHTEINLWRTDKSSHRLTLDGMSKYNTNDVSGSWADYSGVNKFKIDIINGSISIGVQSSFPNYPANYTTIRGFDVSGASGRITWAGNYSVVEHIHSHDVSVTGATVMFHNAMEDYPDCTTLFGNMRDITIRNNVIERGEGEGIYLGGNYNKTGYGGCPSWGNTHSDILIEGNTIRDPGQNGGEGDGIDLKYGLTNVTVRGNSVSNTHNGNATCISSLGVANASTVKTNYLIEGNICNNTQGIPWLVNNNGTTVRNNVLYNVLNGRGIGTSSDGGGSIESYDFRVYNNTLYNQGLACGGTAQFIARNNLIVTTTGGDVFGAYDCQNAIDSDYNLVINANRSTQWPEGSHSQFLPSGAPIFVNPASSDFRLISGSLAIDKGADLSASGFASDFSGAARPQGSAWDIGAYEFVSGVPGTTPPSAPRNLRVR